MALYPDFSAYAKFKIIPALIPTQFRLIKIVAISPMARPITSPRETFLIKNPRTRPSKMENIHAISDRLLPGCVLIFFTNIFL
jgi:hypothetical protein